MPVLTEYSKIVSQMMGKSPQGPLAAHARTLEVRNMQFWCPARVPGLQAGAAPGDRVLTGPPGPRTHHLGPIAAKNGVLERPWDGMRAAAVVMLMPTACK